ncbi:MAG: flagellar hook-basal body complex protein FliE [Pelomonas sp.]|nr:flagellar hook-basal body complex protein FliE [Roseateles sp.]
MNVQLRPFDFAQALAKAGIAPTSPANGAAGGTSGTGATSGSSFGTAMADALKNVSDAQNQASDMSRAVQLDDPNVSLESTMVAIQKAQIGFQAAIQVRNRLVSAYSDIMNMQV